MYEGACCWTDEAEQHADGRGFARAVGSEEPEDRTGVNSEMESIDYRSPSLLNRDGLGLGNLWLTILSKRGTPAEMTLTPPRPTQEQ
jgi:hypothetical protein